jgi:hypothetical protein
VVNAFVAASLYYGRRNWLMITFSERDGGSDTRGLSFPLNDDITGFLAEAKGCHIATILPAQTRGNHYHAQQRELLFIIPGVPWTLYWDEGLDTPVRRQSFSGANAVLVTVTPGASHAVVNEGQGPLIMVGLSDNCYNPSAPDAYLRRVTP